MTDVRCKVCDAPTGDDAWLCRGDTSHLEVVLAELPTLLDELSVTLTRQDHISRVSSSGRRAAPERPDDRPEDEPHLGVKEQGSPMHLGAAAAFDDADDTLGTWACHIAEHRAVPLDLPAGRSQAARCALWLLRHVASLRLDEAVGELYDEVTYVHGQVERVINRPADRIYAGPCHADVVKGQDDTLRVERCELDLYARWGADTITCDGWNADDGQGCRTVHTAADRHGFQLDAVEGALLPLALLRAAVPRMMGREKPDRRTVDSWVRRGLLPQVGLDRHGDGLFRGSDFTEQMARYTPRVKRERAA